MASVDVLKTTLQELAPKVSPGSRAVCKKGCKDCASLHDLHGVFRSVGERSAAKLTKLAMHFLEVNGHDKTDTWKFATALNLAFTLSLLSSK